MREASWAQVDAEGAGLAAGTVAVGAGVGVGVGVGVTATGLLAVADAATLGVDGTDGALDADGPLAVAPDEPQAVTSTAIAAAAGIMVSSRARIIWSLLSTETPNRYHAQVGSMAAIRTSAVRS